MATTTIKFISFSGLGEEGVKFYSDGGTGTAAASYDPTTVQIMGDMTQYSVEITQALVGDWLMSINDGEHVYRVTMVDDEVTIDANDETEIATAVRANIDASPPIVRAIPRN